MKKSVLLLTNSIIAAICAYVPIGVGIALDADTSTALSVGVTGAVAAAYYAAARTLQAKWPALGFLLGVPGTPVYDEDGRGVEVQTVT